MMLLFPQWTRSLTLCPVSCWNAPRTWSTNTGSYWLEKPRWETALLSVCSPVFMSSESRVAPKSRPSVGINSLSAQTSLPDNCSKQASYETRQLFDYKPSFMCEWAVRALMKRIQAFSSVVCSALCGAVRWSGLFDEIWTDFHSRRVRRQRWWCWSVSSFRPSDTH